MTLCISSPPFPFSPAGNFGVVSVVSRRSDNELFVLKQIDLARLDPSVKAAALNEAQLLSSLKHPCIVGYIESFLTNASLDSGDTNSSQSFASTTNLASHTDPDASAGDMNLLCIVMENCAGGDVGELIRKLKLSSDPSIGSTAPPFPEDQILDWFIQLALALKYIHSSHVLHRDLKAQNVFLTRDNRVKVS
jgi:NIMA (never in mitosis gene a)-related kinase